jgi:hypothetical protein
MTTEEDTQPSPPAPALHPPAQEDEHEQGPPPSPLLVGLLEHLPEVFLQEVLPRLNTTERALFARVDHACQAAVVASGLPCAGLKPRPGGAWQIMLEYPSTHLPTLVSRVESHPPDVLTSFRRALRSGAVLRTQWDGDPIPLTRAGALPLFIKEVVGCVALLAWAGGY